MRLRGPWSSARLRLEGGVTVDHANRLGSAGGRGAEQEQDD
jgi:hypothetical protein